MSVSRVLSAIMGATGLGFAVADFQGRLLFDYFLFTAIVLVLIWFPDSVNDYTIGMWIDGYKIENPTPPIMIAGFGWLALLAFNALLFGLI